eukprot:TRINITY_DN6962_c0_g1_i1.p1 TRINITY_DN6962_c0_g1~~TRINITY_DN6962_c0_g1_i1.p1  ORF type:complete len:503 (+),score=229.96 TRINITY_DN6962_c0_g1_i1:109-1617(+)
MPDKKKTKKKAPLSPEEKKARAAAKALKEEEHKKEIAEAQHQAILAEKEREEQMGKFNKLRIKEQWRYILRKVKTQELQSQIEVLSQTHERVTDRKDAIIQRLEKTIGEIEQQYAMALRSHLESLDVLIAMHNGSVAAVRSEFDVDLSEAEQEWTREKQEIQAKYQREKDEVLDVLAAMDRDHEESIVALLKEFHEARDDIKNRNSEEFSSLRFKLDGRIEQLEKEFETADQTYMTTTDVQINKLRGMTVLDDEHSKTIELNNRKLLRLQRSMSHWRTKMTNNVRECESRNKLLKEEKDSVLGHYQQLKGRMAKFQEGENDSLLSLAKCVNKCINELGEKAHLAERILGLVTVNLKLETEKEKVQPYYDASVEDQDPERVGEMPRIKELNPCCSTQLRRDGGIIGEWNFLDNFYKRRNKVELDTLALQREKDKLSQENADLQAILKQYLEGIAVNPNTLSGPNPLLIINNKLPDTIRVTQSPEAAQQSKATSHVVVINPTYK